MSLTPGCHPMIPEFLWEWSTLGLGEKLAADCARPGSSQGDCVQSNLTLKWAELTFEPSLNSHLVPQTSLNPFRTQGITMNIWCVTSFCLSDFCSCCFPKASQEIEALGHKKSFRYCRLVPSTTGKTQISSVPVCLG